MRLIVTLLATFLVASCNTTNTGKGGGRNPYLYPEERLGQGKSVKTTSMDGRFVFLNDGSIWNVNWSDAKDAARWQPGEPVAIKRSGSSSYPYAITGRSGSSVSARYGKKLD